MSSMDRILNVKMILLSILVAFIPHSAQATPVLLTDTAATYALVAQMLNGSLCITYTYDANGNRISQSSFIFGSPGTTWGAGVYGCFNWTP